ncbi:hypothetical protein [Nitrosarchaeum sp.]|uniref:hypothetical protein n=1 Tax=Nitrosarchaeum sp. TaxID=2026886 RepID=UPI00247B6115|nr:hypothetical protein [Nitrosarchaeum sp.]MCV0411565.1 hypothetical protein [Nitrosarchaeum sp.]
MDLLIGLVIAIFIIAAVFVGYHASQESHEEIAESHEKSIDFIVYHVNQIPFMKSISSELIV